MALLRSTFISLSRNRPLRRFSEGSHLGRRLSSRFVAGTRTDEVLAAAAALNQQGIAVTLDSLGENVHSEQEALRSAAIYHELLDAIQQRRLNGNISVKLSQMGMELDPAIAERIVRDLTGHARATGNFVRIDMEGSEYTQATIDLVRRIHAEPGNAGHIGVVIQAYLYRSQADIGLLLKDGIRIRLCKGAYQEPPEKAFPEKEKMDENFVRLTQILVSSGVYHGIATHDEKMVDATRAYVKAQGISPAAFEFQMLYGVRRDLQRALVAEGYCVRVYVPFGTEWYPYFMRRLAERPANVIFLAKNLLKS
ncbi:MAG: proline dehydrogenase [Acidobacteriaceae bacterium]|jgi:proline dehydrogenase|nr:proline dehydrogenase [Acidobacteriaceae bacterium]